MLNWQDRDFLRPLHALLTYGPMALMGDVSFGKKSPLSLVKLYTAIWHPTPRPDLDTLSCQLDLWKVIIKMVRFGHSEFINGISTCMNSWKHLPTFQNMNTPYQIDPSRLWTKQMWNAASVRMQKTPHFEVMTCIRSKVKGTNTLYPKNNAKVSQYVFAKIADIANAIEISDDEPDTTSHRPASNSQEDNTGSRNLDGNSGYTPSNDSVPISNLRVDESESGNSVDDSGQDNDLTLPKQFEDHSESQDLGGDSESITSNHLPDGISQENTSHLDRNSGSTVSENPHVPDPNSKENSSVSDNQDKSTRKKRKRINKGQDTSKDFKPPPKKKKKITKTKSAPHPNVSSTVSVYQQSLEAFSESLFKLPVLRKSEPKVYQFELCDCLYR
jgi:hypothetical protein